MRFRLLLLAFVLFMLGFTEVRSDTFGVGDNHFELEFVPISGDTNPYGWPTINDYSIGKFEVTQEQWNVFEDCLGVPVTGYPAEAYGAPSYWSGNQYPVENISWFKAAQFVNWLNTSTGHHAAYYFAGTQGQSNYRMGLWEPDEAFDSTNLFRHKDAQYFLPSRYEWMKAAYWNGTDLQTWATVGDTWPVRMVESNYGGPPNNGPWSIGSGVEELNGTFDMMGNIEEWTESPTTEIYTVYRDRFLHGGSYEEGNVNLPYSLTIDGWRYLTPVTQSMSIGFRVAKVPEPASITILLFGAVVFSRRRIACQ